MYTSRPFAEIKKYVGLSTTLQVALLSQKGRAMPRICQ